MTASPELQAQLDEINRIRREENDLKTELFLDGAESEAAEILRPIIRHALIQLSMGYARPYFCTDLENAAIFSNLFREYVLSVPGQGWRVYDEKKGIWKRDIDGLMVRRLAAMVGYARKEKLIETIQDEKEGLSFIRFTCSSYGIKCLLVVAESDPGLIESRDRFDSDDYLALDASGQAIDLKTGSVRAAMPKDRFTKSLGAEYTPESMCALWDSFLAEVMAGNPDDVLYLQKLAGYTITGSTEEQKVFFHIGTGANGKGVFDGVLETVFNDYGKSVPAELLAPTRTRSPEYLIASLEGVRAVFIRESQEGAFLDEGTVKNISGGDMLPARNPYERPFSFKPHFTIAVETNHAPRVRGRDCGIWRRIVRIPWAVTIPQDRRDPELARKLLEERNGILRWIVEGAVLWHEEGLKMTRRIQETTELYQEQTDALADFLGRYRKESELSIGASILYEDYRTWAFANGMKPKTSGWLRDQLIERGFQVKKRPAGIFYLGIGGKDAS